MTIRKSPFMPRHHVIYLLLLVIQVTSQPQSGTTGPYGRQVNQVPAVIIGMLIFTLLFSMIACCVCYKFTSTSSPGTISDTDDGGGGGGGVAWTRRTSRGLEKDIINSFPSFLYSQVKGLKIGQGGVECAICLNEFEDYETLRLMPPCSHAFHAHCIDFWLSSRSTCPVCRANLAPKPGNDHFLYPFIRPHTNQDMDLETGNTQRTVLESPDIRLLDGLTWSHNNGANRPPRSRSTGSSNWRIKEILFPRSHSTGHSLVPIGENLDRFTLQLPEEVRRQLSQRMLPQARSSRRGYRSGSVGSERRDFLYGHGYNNPRTISLSFSLSFQNASLHYAKGKDKEIGEGSFERLRPEEIDGLVL